MAAVIGCGSIFAVSPAAAAPCEKHQGAAKAACVKQVKRNAMPYPPNPSWAEAVRRVGPEQLAIAKRVSACEEPGSEHGTGRGRSPWPRYWSLSGGTYVSGFGMAASTYRWAAEDTGYPMPPAATPAMQLLVAVHGGRDLFGWAGWSCF